MAYKNNLPTRIDTIAEIGPGASIGVGLAALISGATKYYAVDVSRYAGRKHNVKIFDELAGLFKKHSTIPPEDEFPELKPHLESYEFLDYIFTEECLNRNLSTQRLDLIKSDLLNLAVGQNNGMIAYFAPWHNSECITENSLDMAYSQAVLEHVEDIAYLYKTLYRWLKPGGFMSHEIDFRCHGLAKEWNGHWAYSDFWWNLMKGRRPYLLNRLPHSSHVDLMKRSGFRIVCDITTKDTSGIQRRYLAPKFKDLSDDDLNTNTAFIQAVADK